MLFTEVPLEYKKLPLWAKLIILPFPLFSKYARENILEKAKRRSEDLKVLYNVEKSILERHRSAVEHSGGQSSVAKLLIEAADNIGRSGINVKPYVMRLEREFYSEKEEMENLSVELLSRFMPLRLAEETERLLRKQKKTNE